MNDIDEVNPKPGSGKEIIVGASIGILVGFLVSLSVSETVGAVLAGLLGLIGALLGLGKVDIGILRSGNSDRIIGFGAGAVIAVAGGLYIRANDLLSPTAQELVEDWKDAGVGGELAIDLAIYQKLGLSRGGLKPTTGAKATHTSSVLFAGEDGGACDRLDNPVYTDPAVLAEAMRIEGTEWAALAAGVNEIDELRARIKRVCR